MESNRFRCHPSIILEHLGGMFWVILFMMISSLDDFSEIIIELVTGKITVLEALLGMGVFLAIVVVILFINWIVWFKTYISIDDEAIVIERNMLNRKVKTLGMKNISNINMEQNIFERIIGTYKIKLDTNSSTTANETDVEIILSKEKALWFKNEVMLRMKGEEEHITKDVTKEVTEEELEYDVEYSAKDILMHCLFTANPVAVIFCLGILVSCVLAFRTADFKEEFVNSVVNIMGSLFAVALAAFSVFQSLIKDFFVYYGFKAKRQEGKIYFTHGLLKKRQYTIAVDKINGLKMVSPVVSRIFGRQYVQVICVGVGDEKEENSKILLSEKTKDSEEKLALLLPEFSIKEPDLETRIRSSLWKEYCSILFTCMICTFAVLLVGVWNVLEIEEMLWRVLPVTTICIVVMISCILGNVLRYKTAKVGLGERNLFIVNGTYNKVSVWIPYFKIQELDYSQGPLGRHFGYARGVIYILAATLDKVYVISSFSMEVFSEIEKRMMLRKGNRNKLKKS